jgi:succinate dehydrogenase/fumarate reductase cytochrome b subunit
MESAMSLHRLTALALAAFLISHLAHHLAGLIAGPAVHLALSAPFRAFWRQPVVEVLLLTAFAVQITTGLRLLWRGRAWRWRGLRRWQALSGVTLAGFLCIHIGAVLAARATGTDTNLHFAAAGMQSGLWALFFAPYYTAAVTALGVHTGIALRRRTRHHWAFPLLTAAGLALGIGLVLLMAGLIHDYTVPQEWRAAFG